MNADQAPVERDLSEIVYESVDASSFVNVKEWSKFDDQIPPTRTSPKAIAADERRRYVGQT
jgi:hypothetical protein